ncbi:MAG: nuclear transport factor 2 family protein [Novosphingobium sp.]|nr:nuclear transport factor 2 family protein [Novosphingobium sp.]
MEFEQLCDRLEIRELAERYTMGITAHDWDLVGSCYHDDARWHVPQMGYDLNGRNAIVAGVRELVEPNELHMQMLHSLVFDRLDQDRSEIRSILHELAHHPSGERGVNVFGIYYDEVTRRDGEWKFQNRRFEIHYLDPAPLPGNVMIDYANMPTLT